MTKNKTVRNVNTFITIIITTIVSLVFSQKKNKNNIRSVQNMRKNIYLLIFRTTIT